MRALLYACEQRMIERTFFSESGRRMAVWLG